MIKEYDVRSLNPRKNPYVNKLRNHATMKLDVLEKKEAEVDFSHEGNRQGNTDRADAETVRE